jgi:hypothetical protein
MYRDEALSMARKIEHLETELAEYRALGARRRQRVLISVSVVSSVIAVCALLWVRREAVQTEHLTEQNEFLSERLDEMRAQLAAARARECPSDIVSPRPSRSAM